MTDTKPLSALYIEEANAFSDRLFTTHQSYQSRTLYRGEPLPGWHERASRELRNLGFDYRDFWTFGTGHRFYEEQQRAGNTTVMSQLQADNQSMYDGLEDFRKAITPFWVRLDLPLQRIAEPAVLVEHYPKRGLVYAASVLFGSPAHYEVERSATLVSHIGNEGGVKRQQLLVNR